MFSPIALALVAWSAGHSCPPVAVPPPPVPRVGIAKPVHPPKDVRDWKPPVKTPPPPERR